MSAAPTINKAVTFLKQVSCQYTHMGCLQLSLANCSFPSHVQDTFLPHVECGTITLIGATTENPSFQVNSALLSRCRVIVLGKLSVEAMETILMRAVKSLGIQVLSQDEEPTSSVNANNCKGSE